MADSEEYDADRKGSKAEHFNIGSDGEKSGPDVWMRPAPMPIFDHGMVQAQELANPSMDVPLSDTSIEQAPGGVDGWGYRPR